MGAGDKAEAAAIPAAALAIRAGMQGLPE